MREHNTDNGIDCWCEPQIIIEGENRIFVHQKGENMDKAFLNFTGVLNQEINWCENDGKGKSGKSEEYEQGFLEGIKQAKDLYTKFIENQETK